MAAVLFFAMELSSHGIGIDVVVVAPGKTYLISDYLMGALVCDIPRQVLHNDKLSERASLHALIRIHRLLQNKQDSLRQHDCDGRINRVFYFCGSFLVILIILKVFILFIAELKVDSR